jgi:serine/threonine-protein kinase RsbW
LTNDEIRLSLPAVPEYARIARLTAAGLATRLGFSYDDVEDLRIAVGEACSILLGSEAGGGRIDVAYRVADNAIEIEVTGNGDTTVGEDTELSDQILAAVVDTHEVDAGGRRVALVKRRSDA